MTALGGAGGRFRIDPEAVRGIGQRFRDHAEELAPHARGLAGAAIASAYGPWAQAAKPLEAQVQKIGAGLGGWAGYCAGYGAALHESVDHYQGKDDDGGQSLANVGIADGNN
ncbi:hypothetical protein Srot_1207 [Segniliparus rotundus DSM 44985]|uniref:Uncharacterized protein n=1 Tax=Segniliparus rotundus (strain ATCC BAA-972 / CDC 1076 / CIP 108378 / DSM 44985 / JCM 13578) TaxID=640132 RepID=D6ZFF4_SEGRD|nr:hypothetical protein [Segniliparus rotundus]ADG97678.1 hypothetical protein Srot_1207 [Segniliparus rotundus DSM 44985]